MAFWPAAGIIHLCLAIPAYKGICKWIVLILLTAGWLIFLAVEGRICMTMKMQAPKGLPWVIVLGAQVRGTRITNSLMRRLDAALAYLEENPDTRVIVSGGQGKGEAISEAAAMSGYLKQHGIGKARIYEEGASTSTRENLRFSSRIIGSLTEPVGIVTNNFHMYRSILLGHIEGYQVLESISASSNPVLFLNYMVREFFAILLTKIKAML